MTKNITYTVIDRLFIVAYGTKDPTDEEWDAYIALVQQHGIDRTMQLIYTEGGGPTATQRARLTEIMEGRRVPVAVLSNSRRVRMFVGILSWFNKGIRAFPAYGGLKAALHFLEVPEMRTDLIDRELGRIILDMRKAA